MKEGADVTVKGTKCQAHKCPTPAQGREVRRKGFLFYLCPTCEQGMLDAWNGEGANAFWRNNVGGKSRR